MEEKIYKQMEEIVMRYFINKNQFRLSSYRDENDYLDPHYLYYRDVELTYNRLDEEEKIIIVNDYFKNNAHGWWKLLFSKKDYLGKKRSAVKNFVRLFYETH